MILNLKRQNLSYSQSDLDGINATLRESLTEGVLTAQSSSPLFQICQPIGPVPQRYGQTPLPSMDMTAEGLKNLPGQ